MTEQDSQYSRRLDLNFYATAEEYASRYLHAGYDYQDALAAANAQYGLDFAELVIDLMNRYGVRSALARMPENQAS